MKKRASRRFVLSWIIVFVWLWPLANVLRAQGTVVWSDSFDDPSPDSRWAVDNGTWQIGTPTIGPAANTAGFRTFSGTKCATTGLAANYAENVSTRLIRVSSFIVPAASTNPRLRF